MATSLQLILASNPCRIYTDSTTTPTEGAQNLKLKVASELLHAQLNICQLQLFLLPATAVPPYAHTIMVMAPVIIHRHLWSIEYTYIRPLLLM